MGVATTAVAATPVGPIAVLGLIAQPTLAATVWTKGRGAGAKIGQGALGLVVSFVALGTGVAMNPSFKTDTAVAETPAAITAPAPVAVTPAPTASVKVNLPFQPSVAPPRPNTTNPIAIKRWNERIQEVARENNPTAFNQPRNGGETTLAQKCEAYEQDYMSSIEFGFQAGFEHDFGELDTDEACRRVQLMGLS